MKNRHAVSTLLATVLLLISPAALAGPPRTGQTRGADRGAARQHGGQAGAGGQLGAPGRGSGASVQLGDQDRDRLRDCSAAAGSAVQATRALRRAGRSDSSFDPGQAQRDHQQLRQHVDQMVRQSDQVRAALGSADRTHLAGTLRSMDRAQQRLQDHLRNLDRALAAGDPSAREIAREARRLERDLASWQRQIHRLGQAAGVAPS